MALTLADYRKQVDHALHGGAPNAVFTDADTTRDQIINDAGEHMIGLHPWPFRSRPPATLSLVASQAYVDLPSDFGEVISLTSADGTNVDIYLSSANEVELYRAVNSTTTGSYYIGYLSYPTQSSVAALAGNARIEIEPTGTSGDQFVLVYRAGWVSLAVSTSVPNIPKEFESLLLQYVSAFARYQDDNDYSAIEMVDKGGLVKRLLGQFSRKQWNYGLINNGAMMPTSAFSNNFAASNSVADPS